MENILLADGSCQFMCGFNATVAIEKTVKSSSIMDDDVQSVSHAAKLSWCSARKDTLGYSDWIDTKTIRWIFLMNSGRNGKNVKDLSYWREKRNLFYF